MHNGFTRSEALYADAKRLMPGGVNSPVRAFRNVGMTPVFIARGQGARVWDEDGNEYIDYVMSWGALILGHAHPRVVNAIQEAAARGTSFGARRWWRRRWPGFLSRPCPPSRWCAWSIPAPRRR